MTLSTTQIETKEYTVDDLKDVIFSRLGQQRASFWVALPSTRDSLGSGKYRALAPWKTWPFTM